MVVLEVKLKSSTTITLSQGEWGNNLETGPEASSSFFSSFSHDDANDGNICKNKKNESNNAKRWNIVG